MSLEVGDWSKITAGPCSMSYGANPVGHTQEGVEFNYEPDIRERVVDEMGSTAVELILVGESIEVTVRITQWELAKLKVAFPAGVQGADYLGLGRKAGYELAASEGAELILHPLEVTGTAYDLTLWKTVAMSPVAIGFNNEGDRIFEVTFKAVAVETKPDGQILGKIGSSA